MFRGDPVNWIVLGLVVFVVLLFLAMMGVFPGVLPPGWAREGIHLLR